MDLAGVISALTTAIGLTKEIISVDHQVDKASLKLKVAELSSTLAAAKSALVQAQSKLDDKDAEIDKLRGEVAFRTAKLVDEGQWRFFATPEGAASGHPICPKCEKKGDYLPLVQDRTEGIGKITYYCPGCSSNYGPTVPYRKSP